MVLKTRKIKRNDIADVAQINAQGWKTACKNFIDKTFLDSLSVAQNVENLKKNFKTNNIIVATNPDVVGFCKYQYNTELSERVGADGEIKNLYVKLELCGCGIGTALFKKVENIFLKQGKHSLVLWCFAFVRAKNFYQKMGGKIALKEKRQIGDKMYDDICFLFTF